MDEKGLPKKGSIGRPKRSEAGAKQIELMERRKRVAELHTQGLYWTAIGLELGISDTQAANDWKAWMAECREYPGREAQREFARASYESDLEAANRDIARAEAAVEAALTVTTDVDAPPPRAGAGHARRGFGGVGLPSGRLQDLLVEHAGQRRPARDTRRRDGRRSP